MDYIERVENKAELLVNGKEFAANCMSSTSTSIKFSKYFLIIFHCQLRDPFEVIVEKNIKIQKKN